MTPIRDRDSSTTARHALDALNLKYIVRNGKLYFVDPIDCERRTAFEAIPTLQHYIAVTHDDDWWPYTHAIRSALHAIRRHVIRQQGEDRRLALQRARDEAMREQGRQEAWASIV